MTTRSGAGVIPPKQQRGRETYDRILDACEQMLTSRRFDEISTADICNEAGVSSSSLYARFQSKDAILLGVIERHAARLVDSRSFLAERLESHDIDDLSGFVTTVVGELVYFARSFDHLELAAQAHPEARARMSAINTAVCDEVLRRALEEFPELSPTWKRHLEFIIRSVASVTHRAVGGNISFADHMRMADDELVEELSRLVLGYLSTLKVD